jgi:cytochrome bd-type quinol oxidase subunit 2
MIKSKVFFISVALVLFGVRSALAATCEINGKEVPCDQMPTWFFWMPVIMLIVFIPLIIFWIKMLIHAIRYEEKNKVAWVLVIVFLQIFGAFIYYFAEKRPNDKKKLQETKK